MGVLQCWTSLWHCWITHSLWRTKEIIFVRVFVACHLCFIIIQKNAFLCASTGPAVIVFFVMAFWCGWLVPHINQIDKTNHLLCFIFPCLLTLRQAPNRTKSSVILHFPSRLFRSTKQCPIRFLVSPVPQSGAPLISFFVFPLPVLLQTLLRPEAARGQKATPYVCSQLQLLAV